MHGTSSQLREIATIAAAVQTMPPAADILICPPSTLIARASQVAAGRIAIGGQNCDTAICGAHTGDVSAQMVSDAGGAWVIVGHSERRQHHGETDAMVADKANAAWAGGLLTIICIGETQEQRRAGQALSVCTGQIAASVPDGIIAAGNAIGYEPLWAIGSGHTPTVKQVVEVHAHIRQCLVARFGPAGGEIRILYGGSVNPANASMFLCTPQVDGALIGGASLKAADLIAILGAVPVETARAPQSAVA